MRPAEPCSGQIRISLLKHFSSQFLTLLILVTATSCLMVPVPASRKNIGPSNLQGSTSTNFIRVGETTKTEVIEKLGWLSAGEANPRIFWGRWITSATTMAYAGLGVASGTNRMWGGRNVIIEFDESGRVSDFRTFDDSGLPKEIAAWTKRTGEKLDLSQPVRLSVHHRHATGKEAYVAAQLALSADQFGFSEEYGSHNFSLAPSDLKILKLAGFFSAGIPKLDAINITLHFRKDTKAGGHVTLGIRLADLLTLLRYVEQVQPQALPPPPKQEKN